MTQPVPISARAMPSPVWRIYLVFAFAYVLSYSLRVINAIIGPPLMLELGLTHADLGLISAAYFIAFAGMQLPLGIWLDRHGARRTEAALLCFAALGCALFASSHSFVSLWLARALIGMGVSGCLMASLKAFRQWFAPEQQSRLGVAMFVAGTVGALSATVPASSALPVLGWRGIFWVMALLLALAALSLMGFLKNQERTHATPAAPTTGAQAANSATPDGYRRIFLDPYFRRLGIIGLVNQASFMAIQSLWAGLWMTQVLGMDKKQSANTLFIFNLALLAGYLVFSWLAPRIICIDGAPQPGKHPLSLVVTLGLALALVLQLAIAALPDPAAWVLWPLLALASTAAPLVQSHIGLAFPPHLAGRANTAYNLLLFVGAFAAQWGIGIVIDQFKAHGMGSSSALRLALVLVVLIQTMALWAFARNRATVSAATSRS